LKLRETKDKEQFVKKKKDKEQKKKLGLVLICAGIKYENFNAKHRFNRKRRKCYFQN
jgi:hypothetical protein